MVLTPPVIQYDSSALSSFSVLQCSEWLLWGPEETQSSLLQPNEISTEDEAEHEDKNACADDYHADSEWEVLETDG